jgi:hypothetical protein
MKKWSVIVPTLWKSPRTTTLIADLINTSYVLEVVVIDNAPLHAAKLPSHPKLKIHSAGENIFVNPAWNWGVEMAQSEHIVLCNDDISFDMELFSHLEETNLENSVIGCHPSNFQITERSLRHFKLIRGHHIGSGWGCLLFFKKSNFSPIPNELKIWCGDDWLVLKNRIVYSAIWPIQTEMSTTSSQPKLNAIAKSDKELFNGMITKRMARRIYAMHGANYGKFNRLIEFYDSLKMLLRRFSGHLH